MEKSLFLLLLSRKVSIRILSSCSAPHLLGVSRLFLLLLREHRELDGDCSSRIGIERSYPRTGQIFLSFEFQSISSIFFFRPPRPQPLLPFFLSFFQLPKNSFGGRSPERVASDALRTLFTFAAAKIILAQLEGSGRGGLAAYDKKGYDDLSAALARFNEPAAPPGRAESCGGEEEEDEEEEEEEEEARRSRTSRETSTCSPSSSSSSSAAPPKKSAFGGGKGDLWLAELSRKNPALALRVMEVRAAYAAEDFEWDQCRRLATEGLAEANLDILKARLGSAWDAAASDEEEEGGGREGEGM